MSPEKFVDEYLYGQKQRISRNMQYGSILADGLMLEEANGDPLLDLMASRLPKLDLMDKAVEDPKGVWVTFKRDNKEVTACVPVLKNKGDDIPILALPDSMSTICPTCLRNTWDMVEWKNEKQQGTICKRSQSSTKLENSGIKSNQGQNTSQCMEEGTQINQRLEKGIYPVEQGNEGNNESMEQGQEVLDRNSKENERIKNGDKVATIHSRSQGKNKQSSESWENERRSKNKKHNIISELEKSNNGTRQLDVSNLQEKRRETTSGSHQTIRSISKTSSRDGKRKDTLCGMPQKNRYISERNKYCQTCHGEPYTRFFEYKTSVRKWTQKMVDESGQITFYATAIWLAKGFIPKDIELVNIETAYEDDGRLTVTGNMFRFPTHRSMADVIKMTKRMRDAWKGICELCEKELI